MTTVDIPPTERLVRSAPVNLRDLGGIPVEGGEIRRGFAIRADDLSLITDEGAKELVEAGVTSVIDLRSGLETRLTGRGPLADHAVTYHHVALMSDIRSGLTREDLLSQDHGRMYVPMYVGLIERSAPLIVNALAVMATAPGTVAFHCAAGKDRTGVLAASLLLALGASDDAIVADYAKTGPNMGAILTRTRPVVAPMIRAMGIDLDPAAFTAGGWEFQDHAMRGTLEQLRERHDGDPLTPVRRAGLSDGLIDLLRQRALGA